MTQWLQANTRSSLDSHRVPWLDRFVFVPWVVLSSVLPVAMIAGRVILHLPWKRSVSFPLRSMAKEHFLHRVDRRNAAEVVLPEIGLLPRSVELFRIKAAKTGYCLPVRTFSIHECVLSTSSQSWEQGHVPRLLGHL